MGKLIRDSMQVSASLVWVAQTALHGLEEYLVTHTVYVSYDMASQ